MNAIRTASRFGSYGMTDYVDQASVFPLRAESNNVVAATTDATASAPQFSKPLAIFKGAFIGAMAVFATIVLALQAVARFS